MVREAGEGREGQIKNQVWMNEVNSLFLLLLLLLLLLLCLDILPLNHEPLSSPREGQGGCKKKSNVDTLRPQKKQAEGRSSCGGHGSEMPSRPLLSKTISCDRHGMKIRLVEDTREKKARLMKSHSASLPLASSQVQIRRQIVSSSRDEKSGSTAPLVAM
jgi:hypothetical protein